MPANLTPAQLATFRAFCEHGVQPSAICNNMHRRLVTKGVLVMLSNAVAIPRLSAVRRHCPDAVIRMDRIAESVKPLSEGGAGLSAGAVEAAGYHVA